MAILYITFIFALHKTQHMITRHNPIVSKYTIDGGVPNDERLDLSDPNFMMIFALTDVVTGNALNDPRYVKW